MITCLRGNAYQVPVALKPLSVVRKKTMRCRIEAALFKTLGVLQTIYLMTRLISVQNSLRFPRH